MTTFLYCFRNGRAYFGPNVPEGALKISQQTDYEAAVESEMIANTPEGEIGPLSWRDRMTARLRHGYEPGVLLVPGIPEADNDEEAWKAFEKFRTWCNK